MAMRVMVGRADNRRAAEQFYDMALAMEIAGERWRANSYYRAAKSIETLGEPLRSISERKELRKIEGVGESIEAKLDEYLATGKIDALEAVRDLLPEDLTLLRDAPTLGTRRVADLDILLGIRSVDELLRAIYEDEVSKLPDFDEEVQRKTLEWLGWKREESAEVPTPDALRSAYRIVDFLRTGNGVDRIDLAGPARRKTSTVANITLLFTSRSPDLVVSRFGLCPEVLELTMVERDQAVGKTASGAACLLRAIKEETFAFEQLKITGSDAHIRELTAVAKGQGHRFTQAGLGRGKELVTEEDVYASLGLNFIPPEMREARRSKGKGKVVEVSDLQGDLHVRSTSLDGTIRVSEMAGAAKEMGHKYICFCDRVGGRRMDKETLERRNALIDTASETLGITMLKGAEVSITTDGRLDFDTSVLDGLDLVIGSVNTKLDMDGGEMTRRILAALDDPNLDVLGHPTNRVIGLREPSPVDLDRIAEKALDKRTALEINAYPDRLDLSDDILYNIFREGAAFSIGTDASFPNEMTYWDWGTTMARKALLPRESVLNSLSGNELKGRAWRK